MLILDLDVSWWRGSFSVFRRRFERGHGARKPYDPFALRGAGCDGSADRSMEFRPCLLVRESSDRCMNNIVCLFRNDRVGRLLRIIDAKVVAGDAIEGF